ncbi:hypothetical protein CEXT_629741 [Caerostris extrusa]|uniref:Uncharacterized protein n=1 Tax=Caerostris extrusa TaxID=172846 RepID=A0AAV4WSB3_CAEEX|nr:hypothetical protein CEXT_629741 [Caerostris extrusa]
MSQSGSASSVSFKERSIFFAPLFDKNELFLFLKHIKGRGTKETFYEKKEFGSCMLQSSCKRSRIKDDFPFPEIFIHYTDTLFFALSLSLTKGKNVSRTLFETSISK